MQYYSDFTSDDDDTMACRRCDDDCSSEDGETMLVEKVPCTYHRLLHVIASSVKYYEKVSLTFSLQVAKLLMQEGLTEEPYANAACSPISMDVALNVLAVGSTGNTLQQLLGVLECSNVAKVNAAASRLADVLKQSDGQEAPIIAFANALWVDRGYRLKDGFRQIVKDVHHAEARALDFKNKPQVVKEVNLWAEEQTKGQIKQILQHEDLKEDTMMILANALSFKGTWVQTFKPEDTQEGDFYLLNGTKVRAQIMRQQYESFEYGFLEDHKCKVLRMLYREGVTSDGEKSKSYSMYIFLPDEKDGLLKLMEDTQRDVVDLLKLVQVELETKAIEKVHIPKFNFECARSLPCHMKQLGLTFPFEGSAKGLSEIVEYTGHIPYVQEILQKTPVEVDEEGTKAVAFTRFDIERGVADCDDDSLDEPIEFVADHPFMFMVREDFSGAVLFVGRILSPLSN